MTKEAVLDLRKRGEVWVEKNEKVPLAVRQAYEWRRNFAAATQQPQTKSHASCTHSKHDLVFLQPHLRQLPPARRVSRLAALPQQVQALVGPVRANHRRAGRPAVARAAAGRHQRTARLHRCAAHGRHCQGAGSAHHRQATVCLSCPLPVSPVFPQPAVKQSVRLQPQEFRQHVVPLEPLLQKTPILTSKSFNNQPRQRPSAAVGSLQPGKQSPGFNEKNGRRRSKVGPSVCEVASEKLTFFFKKLNNLKEKLTQREKLTDLANQVTNDLFEGQTPDFPEEDEIERIYVKLQAKINNLQNDLAATKPVQDDIQDLWINLSRAIKILGELHEKTTTDLITDHVFATGKTWEFLNSSLSEYEKCLGVSQAKKDAVLKMLSEGQPETSLLRSADLASLRKIM
ncbi:hypothetical protein HK096_009395, partial [Nowakowskiella sp. JEL0078]